MKQGQIISKCPILQRGRDHSTSARKVYAKWDIIFVNPAIHFFHVVVVAEA
jgi:hypothetical protein